jgi:hypothetical protein
MVGWFDGVMVQDTRERSIKPSIHQTIKPPYFE